MNIPPPPKKNSAWTPPVPPPPAKESALPPPPRRDSASRPAPQRIAPQPAPAPKAAVAPAPVAMQPATPRPRPLILNPVVAGLALAILGTAGVMAWHLTLPKVPSERDILAAMANVNRSPALVPVAADIVPTVRKHGAPLSLTVAMTWEMSSHLYERVDTMDWFTKQTGVSAQDIRKNVAATKAATWQQVSPFVKASLPTEDPSTFVLVRKVVAKGDKFRTVESITATQAEGGRQYEVTEFEWGGTGSPAAGILHKDLPKGAIAIEDEASVAVLLGIAEAHKTFAQAYASGSEAYKADIAKRREALIKESLARIAPGSVYRMEAAENMVLFLEFRQTGSSSPLAGVLRDSKCIDEARPFYGSWKFDESLGAVHVHLDLPYGEAIKDAGPVHAANFRNGMDVAIQGNQLVETDSTDSGPPWIRRTAEEWAADQAQARAVGEAMVAALPAGSAFRGTMSSNGGDSTFEAILRVVRADSGALLVTIEDASDPRRFRTFSGQVLHNAYRHEGWPLILASARKDHGQVGRGWWTEDGEFKSKWRFDGEALVGVDGDGPARLQRMSAAEVAALDAARKARQNEVFERVAVGKTYVGIISLGRRGPGTKSVLKVRTLDRKSDTIELTISSFRDPRNTASYQGTVSWVDGSISLRRKSGSSTEADPVFTRAMGSMGSLNLRVTSSKIEIAPSDDAQPIVSFPYAGVIESIATDFSGEEMIPAPAEDGTFVLIDNTWVLLPSNNGHLVQPKKDIILGIASGLLMTPEQIEEMKNRPDEMGEVVYDGQSTVPVALGGLVICVRGKPKDFERPAKAPEDYPLIECAPMTVDATGVRRVKVYRIVPGLAGFVLNRIEAEIEQISDDLYVLRSVGTLAPGRYSISSSTPTEVEVR